jgi:hypothetical protein
LGGLDAAMWRAGGLRRLARCVARGRALAFGADGFATAPESGGDSFSGVGVACVVAVGAGVAGLFVGAGSGRGPALGSGSGD